MIQGTAASMMKMAAILLRKSLKSSAKIILLVHDEVIVECDEKDSEDIKRQVEDCMRMAASFFCKSVPPPADAIIADCWYKPS